jgi:hypothetical protein
MILPGPGGISQVDREELDDEGVIVHSTRFPREAVILQPDVGVSIAVVLDNVAWCLKTLWEMSVTHGASKHLWARPFMTEDASFTVITVPTAWV